MEWIADPSIWAGLITLIVIELVLGIDNLVFIAILAEKLPPKQRDRARVTGLLLAMLMRLLLLASISWLVTLTQPLFSFRSFTFSPRLNHAVWWFLPVVQSHDGAERTAGRERQQ